MLVRVASEDDVDALARLYRNEAVFHERLDGGFTLRQGFDWTAAIRSLLSHPARMMLVAEVDDRLVGFVHARIAGIPAAEQRRVPVSRRVVNLIRRRAPKTGIAGPAGAAVRRPIGVIEDCYVDPSARRCGCGRALVDEALSWFSGRGIGHVELDVLVANEEACRFWTALGFGATRIRMRRALER